MCGIFGIIVNEASNIKSSEFNSCLNKLFKLSESRGREASGVGIVSCDAIDVFKRPISASDMIKTKEFKYFYSNLIKKHEKQKFIISPLAVIGHSRLVTNGDQTTHQNNQPVVLDGIVGIHNGIIINDKDLRNEFQLADRVNGLDSEVIFSLFRYYFKKKNCLTNAIATTFDLIVGSASIAAIFDDLNYLTLATNTGSLYICHHPDIPLFLFSSERYILEHLVLKSFLKDRIGIDYIHQIKPGNGYIVNLTNISLYPFTFAKVQPKNLTDRQQKKPRKIYDQGPSKNNIGVLEFPKKGDVFKIPKNIVEYQMNIQSKIDEIKRCSKCILPETMPLIEFDHNGVCNYCNHYMKNQLKGLDELKKLVKIFRRKDGKPDVLIGFSGGRDSSFALHYFKKKLNMNPLTYTYDWGMVTDLARRNISRMCSKLGVENIIISADLNKKRLNIRKNIISWLRNPDLGMVPLFMAGDKQFLYYPKILCKQTGIKIVFYARNYYERTNFKIGFCGIKENSDRVYDIPFHQKVRLALYYGKQFALNPYYINSSIIDTIWAFSLSFFTNHIQQQLFDYIPWDEQEIMDTLINEYDWETASDSAATWRIGDGTSSFYNYIYYIVAGFTENDTFLSNQIRDGIISRKKAIEKARAENKPRFESIKWYCDTIGINFNETIKRINEIPRLY